MISTGRPLLDALFYDWPFLGLLAAAVLVAAFFLERRPRGAVPRWRDPHALLGLMLPVYMLHQFEEHGFDLLGQRYPFQAWFCSALGMMPLERCPGDAAFILAVNVGAVWIAGVLALVYRRKRPLVAACAWAIPLLNAVAHLNGAIRQGAYNPGLATAVFLFIPLSIHVLRTSIRSGVITRRQLPLILGSGVVLHAVLIGGMLADARGLIPHGLNLAVQVANGFMPLGFGLAVAPMRPSGAAAA